MTQLRRELAKLIFIPLVVGVTSGGTFFALNALNASNVSLADERKALNAEHATNEKLHGISRADRDGMRNQIARDHDQINIDRRIIGRLLADLNEMRAKAGLPPTTIDD